VCCFRIFGSALLLKQWQHFSINNPYQLEVFCSPSYTVCPFFRFISNT